MSGYPPGEDGTLDLGAATCPICATPPALPTLTFDGRTLEPPISGQEGRHHLGLRSLLRGGGTGLLILPKWSYQVLPLEHLIRPGFELHAVTVTLPIQLFIVVIYRPPGPLRDFYDEMDALLSCFSENGTPLVVMGDFIILPETLHSPELTNFFATFYLTTLPFSSHTQGREPT